MHFCHHGSLWHWGRERWSNIIGHSMKSTNVKLHSSANNSNATINSDDPVVTNLAKHFKKLENTAEVITTRTVSEMTEEALLQDTSDTKKYPPPWMSKQDSYREYALKSGYEVTFNNCSHAISKWLATNLSQSEGSFPLPASANIGRRIMEILW